MDAQKSVQVRWLLALGIALSLLALTGVARAQSPPLQLDH